MKRALLMVITITVLCILIGRAHTQQRTPDYFVELKTLIDAKVESAGTSYLDAPTVAAIHKAGQAYLTELPISDAQRTDFILTHLRQELREEEKRELVIKIMVEHLSSQSLNTEQCDIILHYLQRSHVGTIDSALLACVLKLELGGTGILSQASWNPTFVSYLSKQDNVKLVLTDMLLRKAGLENRLDITMPTQPDWTAQEKQEITNAVATEQRLILAKRYLIGANTTK